MDSHEVDTGGLGRDVLFPQGDTPSERRDAQAHSAGLQIIATDRYADPLGQFAHEPDDTVAAPAAKDEASSPLDGYTDLPLMSPDAARAYSAASRSRSRRPWAPFAVIGGALAAFASGAYLFATYPAWLGTNERSQVSVSRSDDSGGSPEARPNERKVERATPPDETEAAPPKAQVPAPAAVVTTPAPDEPHSPSLSGEWSMNTRVVSSVVARYEGLRLGYRLRLEQVGNSVTGTGYKLSENDRAIVTKTPITLRGDVVGDRVVLTFQERGTRRASNGKLVLHRESDDVLRGRFSSDAAESTGVVDARR